MENINSYVIAKIFGKRRIVYKKRSETYISDLFLFLLSHEDSNLDRQNQKL